MPPLQGGAREVHRPHWELERDCFGVMLFAFPMGGDNIWQMGWGIHYILVCISGLQEFFMNIRETKHEPCLALLSSHMHLEFGCV